ncbi:MAG: NAD(P)-dependent glycerol-3-phosphate dehydrogenase [Xanthomonadales bacterium]|nr:NAD(P)-dependent glycerol-3-phosphate dehydrogenase [Xanthomonadales bacterium]ODU92109.1 MAG: glycerol-3-phosphate dehydrogenase [Rhodanobacter sp. SCN 66-43]OJY86027.1 MAG: glycerol-3-phosphate dehydrogenase [Xanthomonadales bacterium 66-474]
MPRATVAVLGAGSWGTALAALLCGNGIETRLWGRNAGALARIAAEHRNQRYLPDLQLPAELACMPDLAEALHGVDVALVAVPSHAFHAMLDEAAPLLPKHAGYAWATKGFEPGTGRFLHELVAERLPGTPAAVVTGPSFAREVAAGMPTAVTVHSGDDAFAHRVAEMLHSHTFRAYTGNDMLGAELGGAMKNVLAVATGVADGMQLGLNARAGLITRGMNEMLRLGAALGAQPQTLMGLAGLGDLVLTCTGQLSRNYRFGFALGQGVPLQQALADIGQVVEGAVTADEVMRLAARHDLDLPISQHVQAVLRGDMTPTDALHSLLARERKPEYPANLFA